MTAHQQYLHIETIVTQCSKKADAPCGDVVRVKREIAGTVVFVVDGVGSGIRAHIAAEMATSRLEELLRQGFSLHRAFESLAKSMEEMRDPERPFCAFAVTRFRPDGEVLSLRYEMPPPVVITRGLASVLPSRPIAMGSAFGHETNCYLGPGDGVIVFSDGVSQAGLGAGYAGGWQSQGVADFVNASLNQNKALHDISSLVALEAEHISKQFRDDTSVVVGICREGKVLNVLSGPPKSKEMDRAVVEKFMALVGQKVVCGGTTAEIVSRVRGKKLGLERDPSSYVVPPRSYLEGVNLICEGGITLNQSYNVLGVPCEQLQEDNAVRDLCRLFYAADRVNFIVGGSSNEGHGDLLFRQRGVLSREKIIRLIAEKLRSMGKLVVLECTEA